MAAPAPSGAVDDPSDAALALADPLGALVLALMSRLLTTRAVGAVVDGSGLRVEVVKGRVGVERGDRLDVGEDLPPPLARAGLTLGLPLRYADALLGVVALGPKLSGEPYAPAEVGLARSLAGATAASLAARRSARELGVAHRALAARAHALRTLFELSQAFGRSLDRDAIVGRLAFALMGQLLVRRVAVALCDSDAADGPLDLVLTRGADAVDVPWDLCALTQPMALTDAGLVADGWRWVVPLRAGDVTRGAVLLGAPAFAGPDWVPDADTVDFTAALAALAVGALETADRVEERVERERLREEVRLAREVQARLLPASLPALPGLDVAARWRPSRDVSGDTYHVADLGGRLLVAVADVVGKGIGASLLMATLQAGFRLVEPDLLAAGDPGPALEAATARLDRLVHVSTEPHQFVTLAWAVVDPAGGDVWSVVAGHPPPRLLRTDGRVEPLAPGGPLLGVLPGAVFSASRATLASGDALVLYTDGATEAQNPDGDELETDGLDRILTAAPRSAAALVEAVIKAVGEWSDGGEAEDDDLTIVAVCRAA
ncbi:PP2C family protein-serine/threonine phosphatase [Rubrivirga sp.]|uniref:PP2C family protein-serine/threonine phosphatase n=1 Tax=Rubrivirga sp. TaxID=1885344 RepID=UPI003B530431